MCGPHTSLRTSSSSHPTYGPAKTAGHSQTQPAFSLIIYRGIPLHCGYEKTRWDLIISIVITRAMHTLARLSLA